MASTPSASTHSLPDGHSPHPGPDRLGRTPGRPGSRGGYLKIAGAALCWGLAASVAKFLFIRKVEPLTLAQVRASFSFLVLLPVLAIARPRLLRVDRTVAAGLALLGIAGIAAANFTYLVAIQRTSVTTAILLQYTAPIWVLLFGAVFGGERLTARRTSAVALSFLGCLLAVGGYRSSGIAWDPTGVVWGVAAAFSFAFFGVWGSRMTERAGLWTSLLYALGSASLFWTLVHSPVLLFREGYSAGQWAIFFVYAMLSVLLPYALFYSGLRGLPPSHAMVTATLEPVFAIFFALLLVGERLIPLQVLGMAAVVGSVVLISTGRNN